jgi:DNA-binding transcriptional ArsR family regulator
VSEDEVARVAALLDDATVRCILLATRKEPMSAEQLGERCDVSPTTVYRRLDDLRDADLVEERTELDEDGHHFSVYAATLDRIVLDVTDDGFALSVERRETMSDRFTRFVEGM